MMANPQKSHMEGDHNVLSIHPIASQPLSKKANYMELI